MTKFEMWFGELRILAAEVGLKLTEDELIYYLYFTEGFSPKEVVDNIKESNEINRKARLEVLSELLN